MARGIKYTSSMFSFFLIVFFSFSSQASNLEQIIKKIKTITPMTIKASYKAIPHGQTTYDASTSPISGNDKEYFINFFTLTDLMMSARVSTLTNLYYGRGGMTINQYNEVYALSMQGFSSLKVPKKALPAHQLIVTAIQEHHQFFNGWSNASAPDKKTIKGNYTNDLTVNSSSSKLIGGYMRLISAYKSESSYNKKAFYDHLCALDFK